jgi:hypothetical protein
MYNSNFMLKSTNTKIYEPAPPSSYVKCEFCPNLGDLDDVQHSCNCNTSDTITIDNKNLNLTQNFLYTYGSKELNDLYDSYGDPFETKKECLEEQKKLNNPNLHMFSYDLFSNKKTNPKRFILKEYPDIYNLITTPPIKHLYENFEYDELVNFPWMRILRKLETRQGAFCGQSAKIRCAEIRLEKICNESQSYPCY